MLYQLGIMSLGSGFVVVIMPWLPMNTTLFQVLFYCVTLPMFRELTRFLANKCAWYMSSDTDVGGSGVTPRGRLYSWVFFAHMQVFWATFYRMAVVNMASPWMSFAVVIYQAVLEILLRLTIQRRDEAIGRAKDWVLKSRTSILTRKVTEVTPAFNASQLRVTTRNLCTDTRQEAKSVFYSMCLLTDMMAEYTGIVCSSFLLAFWHKRFLLYPFPWYVENALEKIWTAKFCFSQQCCSSAWSSWLTYYASGLSGEPTHLVCEDR
jgi:hypothetical protein